MKRAKLQEKKKQEVMERRQQRQRPLEKKNKREKDVLRHEEVPAVSVCPLIWAKQSFNCAPPRGEAQITPDFKMTA